MTTSKPFMRHWLLPALLSLAALWPTLSAAQGEAIEPEALAILRRSTDYLASSKQFKVDTQAAVEVVMSNGQKLQFDHHALMTVQRPNKLRAERVGELVSEVFTYDGKTLAVSMPKLGYYATVPAPPTLEAMLDFARDQLDIFAPGSDLVYQNAFERLTSGLTDAYVVGEAVVGGVRCDHLAFRNDEVDWQICIEQGAKPLPRKFVITSKQMAQSPEVIVVMNKWETAPKLNDAMFAFKPGKGQRQIEFVPTLQAPKK